MTTEHLCCLELLECGVIRKEFSADSALQVRKNWKGLIVANSGYRANTTLMVMYERTLV
jgi:hypothetical protein